MTPRLVLTAFAAALFVAACGPSQVVVTMNEDNGSGQTGTATLTDHDDGVEVAIDLAKGNAAGDESAHLHPGKCGELGRPKYPLTPIVDGKSVTKLVDSDGTPVRLASLLSEPYAVNVHSAGDPTVYVSCGNVSEK